MKRHPMPDRYQHIRTRVSVGGVKLYLDVGCDSTNRPGAIFITMEKTGSELRAMVDIIARLVSVGLQEGVPLNRYVDLLRDSKVGPGGLVIGDEQVKMASSVIDYVARHLGVVYAGREELAHRPAKASL